MMLNHTVYIIYIYIGDVSGCVDFTDMFKDALAFNSQLHWDMAAAHSFHAMFHGAVAFSPTSLNSWDTASVQDFSYMFTGATSFSQGVGDWYIYISVYVCVYIYIYLNI